MPRFPAVAKTVALGACAVLVAACGSSHKATASAPPATPPTTVAITTTTTPPVTYTVKRGDTLSNIAKHFGGTIEALVAANHLVDANSLTQGQVLTIPTLPTTTPSSTTIPLVVPTTTTLPVATVVPTLVLTPAHAQVGNVINIKLTGAKPSEAVTFEIDSPDGRKSTGQPHTADADGSVTASYLTTQGNVPGQYTVIASGSKATSARSTFTIDPPTQ